MNESSKKFIIGAFLACLIVMLWSYHSGYDSSIDWEVTTTGEVIEFPAWEMDSGLVTHQITGEKYLLQENYSGKRIKKEIRTDIALVSIMWLGLCLFLVAATYLKRYAFFIIIALFAIFINRINLYEIGLFGIHNKLIIFIPFIALITPLIIFHEYKKSTPLAIRIGTLILLSGLILLGVDNTSLFTDHLIANTYYGFAVCGLFFLFFISEEIIFTILYVVTSGKGGKSNHLHFIILSIIYLGNLVLYYLNKSGLFESSFFLFDPVILLATTSLVSLFSLRFKASFLANQLSAPTLFLLVMSSGITTFAFISEQLIRGNDGAYEAFHYFILYFHIGFGALFFIYTIANFIDPLIKGFEVHKIVYKERNFPYATARLGGFFAVLAFYFLAAQEPFNLLKSGYYNYMAEYAQTDGNELLAKEYILQASYLGYNTHYPNYWLGFYENERGREYAAKTYFHSAAQRFPSEYALVNYGNLDAKINPNKVQAIYEEALRTTHSGEIENNLGVILMEKGESEKSLNYFLNATDTDEWNDAPLINKWHVLKKMELVDSTAIYSDYQSGNYGVKSNVLTTQTKKTDLEFDYKSLKSTRTLHRQAYLLNSSFVLNHDSIERYVRRELANSSDGTANNRLRKALAIHLYNKGEVNKAFMMLDYLQANSHQFYKGAYFDALGKLALDQNAYSLALEFFENAIDAKYTDALFGKLEALASLERSAEIPDLLLKSLKKNPELTDRANAILSNLNSFSPAKKERKLTKLNSLDTLGLIKLGRSNAFHEEQVIAVVETLKAKDMSGGYEILVDAIEINPYSIRLLKKYALEALEWNLIEYSDQAVEKLKVLESEEYLNDFLNQYQMKKKELASDTW